MSKQHKTINWKEIQEHYDSGLSFRDLKEKFGIHGKSLHLAKARGDFVSRTTSETMLLKREKMLTEQFSPEERDSLKTSSKVCSICKQIKIRKKFNKHSERHDGLQSFCKQCNKEKGEVYYANNKETHRLKTNERRKKAKKINQQKVYEFLKLHPCVDCGETDILVLEFDHMRDKAEDISSLLMRIARWEVIETEILKCEVRCANCHRKKTHKDFNTFRYQVSIG